MKKILILLLLISVAPLQAKSQSLKSIGIEELSQHEFKKAYKVFSKGIKKSKNSVDPELYYLSGLSRFFLYYPNSNKHIKTIDLFSQYINLKPEQGKGYLRRGMVYSNRFEYDKAIKDFRKCIEIESTLAEAYYYCAYAIAYNSKDNYEEAHDLYSIFIAMVDSTHVLYKYANHNRALIRKEFKDSRAMSDFKKYSDLLPKVAVVINIMHLTKYDTATTNQPVHTPILTLCGALIGNNPDYIDTIPLKNIDDIKTISGFCKMDSISSYRIAIIKNTKGHSKHFFYRSYENQDTLDENLIEWIKNLNMDDKIIIDKVITTDSKRKQKKQPALSFEVCFMCPKQ